MKLCERHVAQVAQDSGCSNTFGRVEYVSGLRRIPMYAGSTVR